MSPEAKGRPSPRANKAPSTKRVPDRLLIPSRESIKQGSDSIPTDTLGHLADLLRHVRPRDRVRLVPLRSEIDL